MRSVGFIITRNRGSNEDTRLMRPILLDRRRFLQLAAASGFAAAGAAAGWRSVLGQASPAAGTDASTAAVTNVVTAMAAKLGHDPERIFRFVQDDVRYEPYAGILRGASGTLVARAGNAADQATLLAALLRASGIPVRFVSGTIDQAAANALMATTVVDAGTARDRALQSLLSDDDVATGPEWTVTGDIAPEALTGLLDLHKLRTSLERDGQVLGPLAARHAQESIDLIQAALSTAGIQLPSGVSGLPPLEQERHVWVQAQQDRTTWTDFDPTFADLPPGQAATTVAETLETLPDELRHLVDFTVIAETLTGGTLVQEPILEAAFFADQLAYQGVLFGHAPAEELQGIDQVNLLGSGLSDGTAYNALLLVGPLGFIGPRSISIGGGGGAGGGLLGGLGGGGDEGLVEGETSAEWLDVGVSSPGREPVIARRAIFDRVGTAMRESGVIDPYAIPAAELVDLGDGAGAHFLPMRSLRAFSVSGGTPNVRTIAQEYASDDIGAVAAVPAMFESIRALLGADVGSSLGSLAFPDAPAVTSLVAEPTPTGMTAGFDVWHRPFGTVSLAGVATTAPPAMVAGVIPYAVERALISGDPASGAQPAATPISVGAVFEAAAAQGIAIRLLSGSLPADTAYDAESRRFLRRALDAGQLVVIPERAVDLGGRARLGWWLVDPVSGAVVDQMDDGGGTIAVEKLIIISVTVLVMVYFLPLVVSWILCRYGISSEALQDVVGRMYAGLAPTGCGASGPETPGPRLQPQDPHPDSPILQDPALQRWKKQTQDNSVHSQNPVGPSR